jgi:hypothetical protein
MDKNDIPDIIKKDKGIQAVINNGWNNVKILQLRRKMIELKIYRYLHKEAGTYYKKLHQKLFLPHTTIMTVASGTLFVSLSSSVSDNNRYWINLFVSFLTLIGTILSVWVKFFDAENISNTHMESSKNYSLIIEDIDEELSLEYDDKSNYTEYINKIKKMISEEKKKSLEIDKKFWDNYLKSVSKGELVMLNYNIIDNELNREINKNDAIIHFDIKDYSNFINFENNHNFDINEKNNNEYINSNSKPNEFLKMITNTENDTQNNTQNSNEIQNSNEMQNSNEIPKRLSNSSMLESQNDNNIFKNLAQTNIDTLRKNLKYQLERNIF